MRIPRFLSFLAGGLALLFIFTGSKCESQIDFPAYSPEVCGDKIDNNDDGLVDCADSDCKSFCRLSIQIDPINSPLESDSLTITGTHKNASKITITLTPSGQASTPNISGDTWKVELTKLSSPGSYKIVAVAKDTGSQSESATATLTRK